MIRYFCTVRPGPGTWADLGYAYFLALRQVGPVRVVPAGLLGRGATALSRATAIVGGAEIVGRWEEHAAAFSVPVADEFVNVVCGDGQALTNYLTVGVVGVKNVAITAVMFEEPTTEQLTALPRYDLVLCPTQSDVDVLGDRGIGAMLAPAEPDAMGRLLKGMA